MNCGLSVVRSVAICSLLAGGVAQAQIKVTEARIGCLDSPTANQGNLTSKVAEACNGKFSCSYKAPDEKTYRSWGVQAHTKPFCTQAMEILYQCGTGPIQSAFVPGDAWLHDPAVLVCPSPAPPGGGGGGAPPQNPQIVPILQKLLQKYRGCILERYETQQDMRNRGLSAGSSGLSSTNGLHDRDIVTCVAGNPCSRASRQAMYTALEAQANRGDPTNFATNLRQIIPADCFQCQKHQEWHTKHVHCTMDCG
ncbi:MAG TPA: hypothetical protein VNB49_12600, partial [Candidatus Dormibacteraeota bacterium]|nr:hypothetical protein [Candidatus Dormibacteraeota bacterium]